jgi:L-lactate utilization protein LutB
LETGKWCTDEQIVPVATRFGSGACGEVCPVKIPIPGLLIRLRGDAQHNARPGHAPPVGQGAKSTLMDVVWAAWAARHARPALYRGFAWLATHFVFLRSLYSRAGPPAARSSSRLREQLRARR